MHVAFMDLAYVMMLDSKIDSSIYARVFSGEVDCNELEDVFVKFNISRPSGYAGRSLSVSDIVEIVEAENVEQGFYYCDNVSFKKVEFDPNKTEPFRTYKDGFHGKNKNKNTMVSFAISIEDEGKYFAYPLTIPQNSNIVSEFAGIKGLKSANYYPSRKKAKEIADFWNKQYKENGTYLYQKG